MTSTLTMRTDGPVAVITLAGVKFRSFVDEDYSELQRLADEVEARSDIRGVLVLSSAESFANGPTVSLDGQTIDGFPDPSSRPFLSDLLTSQRFRLRAIRRWLEMTKPKVAAVNGHCYGLGAALAMACDEVVVADNAIVGDGSIRFGRAPANPLWTWVLGPRRAREVLFGRHLDASTAVEWGFATQRSSPTDLSGTARERLEALMARGGMGGVDGQVVFALAHEATRNATGLASALDVAAVVSGLSGVQRYGLRLGEYSVWDRVKAVGLEAAVAEADQRYLKFTPKAGITE